MHSKETVTDKQKYVEMRLKEAALTLRRLPENKVQGYFSTWPHIKRETVEILNMERTPVNFPPLPEEITAMEEVLFTWLRFLEPDERRLVWKRSERTPWKVICVEFGIGRTKAWEIQKEAIGKIAARI